MASDPRLHSSSPEGASSGLPQIRSKLNLKRHFDLVSPSLLEVEERIRRQAKSFDPGVVGYVDYACESRGKRIRPALVLLMAEATGKTHDGHLDIAVVVELIHLATLVHDDIMDGAGTRRGQPTVFAKWGAELSVLLGDCLFAHALKLCAQFPTNDVSRCVATAAGEVCSGEILQTQRRFDLKLSINDYLKMIQMKTAALFEVSTQLAAELNDQPQAHVEACAEYGNCLGIAYQIYDDCLDLVGMEATAGKTLGTDLAKGKLTLPVLHVLRQLEGADRERIHDVILHGSDDEREGLLGFVAERGGLKYAVRKVVGYLDQATQSLSVLPESECRTALQEIPLALREHVALLEK